MDLFSIINTFDKNVAIVDGEKKITYSELFKLIKSNVRKLNILHIYAGDKIVLAENNQMDFIIILLSLLAASCWVVPVQADMFKKEYDVMVQDLDARLFDMDSFNSLTVFEESKEIEGSIANSDMCGILHLTSGTTSKPKFCVRNLNALVEEGLSFKKTFSIEQNERFMSLNPLSHSFAFGAIIMASFVSGGCIYATKKFIPWNALSEIRKYHISFVVMVPFMTEMLVKTRKNVEYDLSSLRVALVGAGKVSLNISEAFFDRFGIHLMSNYGSTETGGIISRLDPQPFNSIGIPHYGVQVKIVSEDGSKTDYGEIGELCVKSKGMLSGYYQNDSIIFDEEGFFHMGDLARYDSNGNIYIEGRKKWIVNIAGKKVNPFEVEEVLKNYSGIDECVVIGCTREKKEESLIAIIVSEEIDTRLIIQHCLKHLSRYKVPKRFIFVDQLPRNKSGKISRENLLELL